MQRVACSLFAVATLWADCGAYSARAAPPEEIVVTAERRERPLAHAPLSAVVASGADLRRSGIESSQDLPFRTPGLAFSTNTVLGQPYLRGVGSDLITAGAESSVATLVDGVYRTRPVASIQEFFDVERVEVLMGPQGALFGRNATGGLIHVVTRDPEPGVAAEGDVSYGNFDAVRVRGALNLPLAGERAVLRIAGLRARRDGFTRELSSGEAGICSTWTPATREKAIGNNVPVGHSPGTAPLVTLDSACPAVPRRSRWRSSWARERVRRTAFVHSSTAFRTIATSKA